MLVAAIIAFVHLFKSLDLPHVLGTPAMSQIILLDFLDIKTQFTNIHRS